MIFGQRVVFNIEVIPEMVLALLRIVSLFLEKEQKEYPLGMKMMFNFHAESNAQAILKSMQKETIVAHEIIADLPKSSDIKITPHPNIVKMYTAFSDYIPSLSESMELYPHALPPRINPQGMLKVSKAKLF